MGDPLDEYLPEPMRAWIEQRYYARVTEQARFSVLIRDSAFWESDGDHVGLFSDHGVVHVRDVARQILQVLDTIHGLLIPQRSTERFAFMKGYGVALAYLHDIGMVDFSAFGRAMHPEFAAHAVFSAEFDELIATLWEQNCAGLRTHITALALAQPAEVVLREILALSMAHSKSKVPIAILNDRAALRSVALRAIGTDLLTLYHRRWGGAGVLEPANSPRERLQRFYTDVEHDAFAWLIDDRPEVRTFVEDLIDTMRALRSADALRQRGTLQKTSAGYEVFISQQTGGAIYALRLGDDQLYMLERRDRMSAGEANIASTELDRTGNLRISFHRGTFATQAALTEAVAGSAIIVHDIQADVIDSYHRPPGTQPRGTKLAAAIEIWIESTNDNPNFADMVRAALQQLHPESTTRVEIVPSLQSLPDDERKRYLAAANIVWSLEERRALLEQMAHSGSKTAAIDPEVAFRHVRLAQILAGELLIEAGAPGGMVYVPLGEGLRIYPLGGYDSFSVQAWMPLGSTGIIRGAFRNARVVAEQDVSTIMIPKDVYLRHWHHTYTMAELQQRLG